MLCAPSTPVGHREPNNVGSLWPTGGLEGHTTQYRTLHTTLYTTLHCTLHCRLHCTLHCTLHITLQPTLYSTLHWTLHCTLYSTLHWTLHCILDCTLLCTTLSLTGRTSMRKAGILQEAVGPLYVGPGPGPGLCAPYRRKTQSSWMLRHKHVMLLWLCYYFSWTYWFVLHIYLCNIHSTF